MTFGEKGGGPERREGFWGLGVILSVTGKRQGRGWELKRGGDQTQEDLAMGAVIVGFFVQ